MKKTRKAGGKIEAKSKPLTDTWVGGMRHPVGVYKQKDNNIATREIY